jgi:hypothetical protein
MPICPAAMALSFNKILLACLPSSLLMEQENNQHVLMATKKHCLLYLAVKFMLY